MMFEDFFGFPRQAPLGYGPRPTRQSHYYYDDEEDSYAPRFRQAPPQRRPQRPPQREEEELPELELETYPGKGWTASAQLSRGLNSNNIKLQLSEDEDGEPFFLINALVTKPATYYTRATTTLTPLARCRIPREGDTDNTSAFVKNGILTLMIPKKKGIVSRESPQHVPINRQPQQHRKVTPQPQSQQQKQQATQHQRTRIPVQPESPSQSSPSPRPVHHNTSNVPVSPATARRLQILSEEEDVFERSLKYAVPE